MTVINQVMVEVMDVVGRGLEGRDTTPTPSSTASATSTSPSPSQTSGGGGGGGGPTNSPLLFFVALGFGVVFTNLWIIVGVKYCFRYNARNRAIRNGEEVDPIGLENVPTRPHRRRREKKLMTTDEVNERFPLMKYKNWMATRAMEGLSTAGGVTAPSSRAGSVRDVEGIVPTSPVDTKHSVITRPTTATSGEDESAIHSVITRPTTATSGEEGTAIQTVDASNRKSTENKVVVEKEETEEHHSLEQVPTTASTVNKHATATSEDEEEDDDEQIHTAIPPELINNPGDSCAICIDTLEEDDDVRGLTCSHVFHAGCLDPWLTSRRACCPLCKADYYTPKPRPDAETADADNSHSRRSARNHPAPPPTTWAGAIRGNRLVISGRLGSNPGDAAGNESRTRSRSRRTQAAPPSIAAARASRRFQFSNPLRNIHLPGRGQASNAPNSTTAEVSPSTLEAGEAETVR